MADEVMDDGFEPCWLYHPVLGSAVAHTAEEYARYMAAGGWAHTQAELGIITNPSAEQLAMMRLQEQKSQGSSGAALPAESLLLTLLNRLDKHDTTLAEMQNTLAEQDSEIEALHKLVGNLQTDAARPPSGGPPNVQGRKQ